MKRRALAAGGLVALVLVLTGCAPTYSALPLDSQHRCFQVEKVPTFTHNTAEGVYCRKDTTP